MVQGEPARITGPPTSNAQRETPWALSVLRGSWELQDAGGGLRAHPSDVEEVAWPEKLEEPDKLGAVCEKGGNVLCAAAAANPTCVLMGSNSHVALWSRYPQGHPSGHGRVLTNRMSELLTYGSVGGAGRK